MSDSVHPYDGCMGDHSTQLHRKLSLQSQLVTLMRMPAEVWLVSGFHLGISSWGGSSRITATRVDFTIIIIGNILGGSWVSLAGKLSCLWGKLPLRPLLT